MYGFYLLHHGNGQMHVCLITSFVKIITKCVAVVYRFKSAKVVSSVFLGCDMPIQLVLSSEYDDRLEDKKIVSSCTNNYTKYVTFYA